MGFKSCVLGGAAAAVLMFAGISTGFAQQTTAPPSQDNPTMTNSAPAATDQSDTSPSMAKPKHHARHHYRHSARYGGKQRASEVAETRRLNQESLQKTTGYGAEPSMGPPAPAPSDQNPSPNPKPSDPQNTMPNSNDGNMGSNSPSGNYGGQEQPAVPNTQQPH